MFTHQHHVPILKWKQGEYQGASRLDPAVKKQITPLFEVPGVGYDHEAGKDRETIDEHLADFGTKLKAKWPTACFVDAKYLLGKKLDDGTHCVSRLFALARADGCEAIPVVELGSDAKFRTAVAEVAATDGRGACLRLKWGDAYRDNLGVAIGELQQAVGLGPAQLDLILDFGAHRFDAPMAALAKLAADAIRVLPNRNRWRTFTLAASSFPDVISALDRPIARVPRNDWALYKLTVKELGSDARIPTYSDYTAIHPDLVELDMRIVKPFAKLRYTTSDFWHIGIGTPVRTHGFGQYRSLCSAVVREDYFDGAEFSAGDRHIAGCADGTIATGNLSTWVWVAVNRHVTRVVADLAIFHGS